MKAEKTASVYAPEIVLLYCRQTLNQGEQPAEGLRQADGFSAKLVLLPCSSKMQVPQLLQILKQGADALQIVACPEKTCRFLAGNSRAQKRIDYARDLLDQVGMGAERLSIQRAASLNLDALMDMAGRRAELVKEMGPNPMKGDIG